jgi:protein-tyrosine-phosphatase/DNA-binding transcriptional ArsR family regulator
LSIGMTFTADVAERAARHAALGDPARLTIVEELFVSDRAPTELRHRLGMESNLLAHHLDVLERVGLIERSRSSGDGRRRYVHLIRGALEELRPGRAVPAAAALFVCSANSARSQLAAALWAQATGAPAISAGTHPAACVHPGAVSAARRAGLDLSDAVPQDLEAIESVPPLVVTVCDRAHEQLDAPETWLHWSVPDPVPVGTSAAFDAAVVELDDRIRAVTALAS